MPTTSCRSTQVWLLTESERGHLPRRILIASGIRAQWVAALHKEAVRVLMRGLGSAIANQIQMARAEGWMPVVDQHDD